ncbi:MAG: transglycosylase domain-containing protein [Candidatus Babeliales bacterium]
MRIFYFLFILIVISISTALGAFFFIFHSQYIDFSPLQNYNPGRPTIILDDQGNEWARFQLDRREPILFEEIPEHLKQAFIAAEDHDFWSHAGISWKGIIRSFFINCYYGRIVQGASTITQQLVKLLFCDARKTLARKIKEQFIALIVEKQFSKEHIFQTYLNHVYFGCGIYGVEAACQRFWKKHASEISLDEAAVLAAVVKSPGQYCPLLFPLSTQKRRDIILHAMYQLGFIKQEEYETAKQKDLHLIDEKQIIVAPHLKETIRIFLEQLIGKDTLYSKGLIVQTTINKNIQICAQNQFNNQIKLVKDRLMHDIDGALICMHSKTGEIKALVGGANFKLSKFNRALQAKRQFGSIFKPIVFAAAINNGMSFADTEIDEPFCIEQGGYIWKPQNSSCQYEGQMTLARALCYSNNIITIKTLLKVGISNVIELAKKLHLSGSLPPYPSLALGCIDGTLKEAAGMFNVFANNGVYIEPHFIKWVKNQWGTKLWKQKIPQHQVLTSAVTGQVIKVLGLGMARKRMRQPDNWITCDSFGKTGTTNDCRTCWFCGATTTYTTALYLGCDDNQSMGKHVFAASTAFPIWLELNKCINHEKQKFSYDPSLKEIYIDSKTGKQYRTKINASIFSILIPKAYR